MILFLFESEISWKIDNSFDCDQSLHWTMKLFHKTLLIYNHDDKWSRHCHRGAIFCCCIPDFEQDKVGNGFRGRYFFKCDQFVIDGDVRITYFAVVFMSMEARFFKLSRVLILSLMSTEELRHVRTTCDLVHPIISIILFSVWSEAYNEQ